MSWRGVSDLNEEVPTFIFLIFAAKMAKFNVFSIPVCRIHLSNVPFVIGFGPQPKITQPSQDIER